MKDFNLIQSAFEQIGQDNACFRIELGQVCTVRRLFFGESEFKIVDESSIDEVLFAEAFICPVMADASASSSVYCGIIAKLSS